MLGLILLLAVAGALVAFRLAADIAALRRRVGALQERLDRIDGTAPVPAPLTETQTLFAPGPRVASAPVPLTPALARPMGSEEEAESLESRIGGQWLLYIGVFAILLGVAYFEKLAFENEWLGETARVVQGAFAGLLLVYGGTRFVRAGYRLYGQAIAGAGIAVMYVSAYASFNFYHLVDRPAAFALMVAITLFGAWLADRQQSQGLALFAVGGGFLTPFLLPGTTDAQIALFGYDAILAGGAALLARRRAWALLYATSYLFVLLTVAAWADRFYAPNKYLRTEIFLSAFCALFAYMLLQCRGRLDLGARVARMFLLTAPLAYYFASVAVLFDHPPALLIWLLALATIGGIVAARAGGLFGVAFWVAVAAPLVAWCSAYAARGWLTTGLAAIAGVYAISLASQLRVAAEDDDLSAAEIAWLHLTALGAFLAAYLLVESQHVAWTSTLAALCGAWQGAIAAVLWARRRALATHYVALGLTFAAIAIALQFDGPAVIVGWGAEAFVAVVLGIRQRRTWLRIAGLALFAFSVGRAIAMLFADPHAGQSVLLNRRAACASFLILLAYAIAWLHARHLQRTARAWHVASALLTAQVMTLSLATSEITAYWAQRGEILARDVMLSVTWAAYATMLVLIGLRRQYAPIRLFAMAVLAGTIVKVFAVDLSHLQRVYRVVSVIGLGIMLLVTSYLYQRARRGTPIGSARGDDQRRRAATPGRS